VSKSLNTFHLIDVDNQHYVRTPGSESAPGKPPPQKKSISPIVKHTGQELVGKLCEILKF